MSSWSEETKEVNCNFIEELEERYETKVGERGSRLSGKQKDSNSNIKEYIYINIIGQ